MALLLIAPFAALLLCIAVAPLVAGHWWEHNRNKALVVLVLAGPMALWLGLRELAVLGHTLHEYLSFVTLLGALFTVSGGIYLSGDLQATPRNNTLVLGAGAVLANLVGTTGASMLLIRLFLRTNKQRRHVAHLPFFFILVVSNCGGLLTPLGDPPLFLGYLRGVPFTWTLRLFPVWLLVVGYLLAAFYWYDRRAYAREETAAVTADYREAVPLRVHGWLSVSLLALVVAAVFLPTPYREIVMWAAAGSSLAFGSKNARKDNEFAFGPIVEVAILFAGIFVTMVPALQLLEAHGAELGIRQPWQFFVVTGALSSVLDNAPTYLTFVATAQGLNLPPEVLGIPHLYLLAISAGAVLMGANTYIGNGPNFMVKAIADFAGYKTFSFMRHAGAAIAVLMPGYLLTLAYLWLIG